MRVREVANKSCITKRKNINALIYNDLMLSYGCVGGLIRIFLRKYRFGAIFAWHSTILRKLQMSLLG
ncbi:hypothetical protein BFX31_16150 [Vibrio paracholerae]|nr:hypothetical protein BFX31_16150 [Vibrio paracholerae]